VVWQIASVETEDEEDAQYAMVGEDTEIEIAEEPIKVRQALGYGAWGQGQGLLRFGSRGREYV
jgi:hypothetical protein